MRISSGKVCPFADAGDVFRARAEEEEDFNSRSSASGNEDDPPEVKQEKEKERRQANNARERYVLRICFYYCCWCIVKRFSLRKEKFFSLTVTLSLQGPSA